ncbi:hypothetical protein AQJ66_25965 [Streptomyces bungoensis]|uniref:Uncharacterized protein n=1 Tax=Streptomyces bungoensis TaxID=285568 RepID=A0A101SUS7_9ACTN|nr:hypothetical protein [Streptomyces bungoensis]KUN80592.1 hypothetical protein AQJ66_25965 [Streptomyces bungoensis]
MAHRTQPDTAPREATETAPHTQRFSRLPERIRPEDMVETRPATLPDPARDRYHADEWLVRYCG